MEITQKGLRQMQMHAKIGLDFARAMRSFLRGDPDVIEYHLLLIKLSGIDGVIVDWYGLTDYRDYSLLHENTERLVQQLGEQRVAFQGGVDRGQLDDPHKLARSGRAQLLAHPESHIDCLELEDLKRPHREPGQQGEDPGYCETKSP